MAKSDTWMPLYIGDYLADTSRLTTEGHGAYLLIIMDYWRNGAPPDDDEVLASIAKMSAAKWAKIRGSLSELFTVKDGRWMQGRVERERAKATEISANRRESGRRGGVAKAKQTPSKPVASATANGMANDEQTTKQNDRQSPSQDSVAKATDAAASSASVLVDGDGEDLKTRIFGPAREWLAKQAGLTDKAARTMLGKWCSQMKDDGRVLEALQQASRNAPLDPVPYIEKLLRSPRTGPPGQPQFKNAFAQLQMESHLERPDHDQ